jgi:hypothetical protein
MLIIIAGVLLKDFTTVQDHKATNYLAHKEDVRREDARRCGEKKS